MKKIRALLGLCVILVALGCVFALRRQHTGDELQPLLRYATSVKISYVDPGSLYAPLVGPGTGKPGVLAQPMQIRSMKLQNVSFEQLNKILHRELTAKKDWHFESSPSTLNYAIGQLGFISAFKKRLQDHRPRPPQIT